MTVIEKQIPYTSTNTYSTLNSIGTETKNIWVVFHGIGYLSRYFIKFFDALPADENYIIAPQAPSKYYLNGQYKYIGASWLTKENTTMEIENIMNYIDALISLEALPTDRNLIIFGFSQGVSIAARWVAKRKIACNHFILYAGGLPKELKPMDFAFLTDNRTEVTVIVGDNDEYLTPPRMLSENKRIDELFQKRAKKVVFEGGHEIKKDIIYGLVSGML